MTIRYWPFFCEENIWHLCADNPATQEPAPSPREADRVVFISNARRQVAMRNHHAGGGGPVLWDYHVVLLAAGKVWDLDSTLGPPLRIDHWMRESFRSHHVDLAPRFRMIDRTTYVSRFASDRSHMLGPDGVPLKPLPPWPRIGVGMNLMRFVDMESPFLGEIADLGAFQRLVASGS